MRIGHWDIWIGFNWRTFNLEDMKDPDWIDKGRRVWTTIGIELCHEPSDISFEYAIDLKRLPKNPFVKWYIPPYWWNEDDR
jgi:hypothetical protein